MEGNENHINSRQGRSRARRHFYGTKNEIWAGFGPVGNPEKNGG